MPGPRSTEFPDQDLSYRRKCFIEYQLTAVN